MYGTDILTRTISVPMERGSSRLVWQYNSRSDHHSKVACWGVLFDLLNESAVLASQAAADEVVLGINFEIKNYTSKQKKNLDLVVARPEAARRGRREAFKDLVDRWSIVLTAEEQAALDGLPDIEVGEFGANAVRIALEAKACMTAHAKAGPRLYDELNSSHQIVHSASEGALAIGFAMVNAAETFLSSVSNPRRHYTEADWVSEHQQPEDTIKTVKYVESLPRRSGASGAGYDGLALVIIDMPNDGSPVRLVKEPPAPAIGDVLHYDSMIHRVANEYDSRFRY